MSNLVLHVLHASDVPEPSLSDGDGMSLARWFGQASGEALRLEVRDPVSVNLARQCRSYELQAAIRTVLGTPQNRPVGEIALVFAGAWAGNNNLEGVMFDYDGTDSLLGTFTSGNGVPREACAVFVDAIGATNPTEVLFAAIHELGHVFNLQHDTSQNSFMATSRQTWGFSPEDCDRLAAAGRGNWYYAPGGANFGSPDGAAFWNRPQRRFPRPRLSLRASSSRTSYLSGELVVVDLNLRTTMPGEYDVPYELDPGYGTLRIWIETRAGERWLFRPPLVYCRGHGGRVTLGAKRPLRHNPRVSLGRSRGESPNPGRYKLWVESILQVNGSRLFLRSEPIEIEVMAPRNVDEELLSRALTNQEITRFTSEKGGALTSGARATLTRAIRRTPKHPATQHLRYALGTALLNRGRLGEAAELFKGVRLAEVSLRRGLQRSLLRLTRARRKPSGKT